MIPGKSAYFVYKKALGRLCERSEEIQSGFPNVDGAGLLHFVRKDGSLFSYFISCVYPDYETTFKIKQ